MLLHLNATSSCEVFWALGERECHLANVLVVVVVVALPQCAEHTLLLLAQHSGGWLLPLELEDIPPLPPVARFRHRLGMITTKPSNMFLIEYIVTLFKSLIQRDSRSSLDGGRC